MIPGLNARVQAARMLQQVLSRGVVLEESDGEPMVLSDRDMGLTRAIVTSALRRLGTLDRILSQFLRDGIPPKAPELEYVLLVALAQLLLLDVPDHSSVDLAVHHAGISSNTRPFKGLVNAVLRRVIDARDADDLPQLKAWDLDLPGWLARRWLKQWGEASLEQIARMAQHQPTLDLTVKEDAEGWAARLGGLVLPQGSVRLVTQTPISQLEGYDEGAWWVQDAAASLPVRLLAPQKGEAIADVCAAPGGKTAQLTQAGANVTAYDRSYDRMEVLERNLARLKLSAQMEVGDVFSLPRQGPFDAILLDAPCSATGTLRRNPDVIWAKRAQDIEQLAQVQARMLDRIFTWLKPGGRMIYCVCSLDAEEGEAQIADFLRRQPGAVRLPFKAEELPLELHECLNKQGEVRTFPYHLPHSDPRLSGMDGFFIARIGRK